MTRPPIFSIHSVVSTSNEAIRIKGRALDIIEIKSKVFDSNSNIGTIEEITIEDKQVRKLDIMSEGIITITGITKDFQMKELLYEDRLEEYKETITFEQAKNMAEHMSRQVLLDYVDHPNMSFLDELVLEADCCWFFFYNPQIIIPQDKWLLHILKAYAISKKGSVSHTYNYLDDPVEAKDYLHAMSGYFRKRGL